MASLLVKTKSKILAVDNELVLSHVETNKNHELPPETFVRSMNYMITRAFDMVVIEMTTKYNMKVTLE